MPSDLTTAHEEWDVRWADEAARADWLTPQPSVEALIPGLVERGARRVVDLGCGVGRHALAFARAGLEVLAIDGSQSGLDYGRQAAEADDLAGIDWQLGDFQHIPAEDACIDHVLIWNVIYHGTHNDLAASLAEIARVLVPGGTVHGTLLSKRNGNYRVGREVAPDTWINDSNPEKAHAHCYCSAADVTRLLGPRLEVQCLEDTEHKYPGSTSWHWEFVAECR